MIKNFRFKDIKSFLEEENIGVEILDKFDKLFDAVIIFTPIALGPAYLPLLTCLEVKDRLVNIGKSILESINSICKPDYVTRAQQIKYAYALIVYTSYLDALDEILPKKLIKELKKELKDKEFSEFESVNDNNVLLSDYRDIPFSDHIDSYSETIDQLNKLYENASERMLRLIDAKKSEIDSNGKFAIDIKTLMTKVNKLAIKNYEAQYLDLASNFNDFAFYVQSLEFQSIQKIVKEQSKRIESIDVGFRTLNELVNSLNNNSINSNSQDIVEELKSKYQKEILKPIIKDKEIYSDDETVKLKFPRIVDAFIPQSYKCLSYTQRNIKLEEPEVWNDLDQHNDLDAFFIKYLSNPNSIDNPLIILGHPGSGKSLLTKVLSAQLMCDYYTVIRIPLREVNAESSIDMLVENQIRNDSNRPLIYGYGGFAKEFSDKPLLIILDGYDELLQAKGEVYSNYIQKVKEFQEYQKDANRPVRIIVTSRITLIDKAIIPENSTIVRLLEFNEEQQKAWISIWNKENKDYFKYNNVEPFSLPDKSNKSIMELSEQPLLLLMLALYDSEGNSLVKLKNEIKRTQLYNNLIRRFVLRERRRYDGFLDLESNEQVKILNKEMSRLGVVAIGMYNRQTVHIHSNELENDLKFYNLNREKKREVNGKKLNDSDSLLAGFFFIHESKAQDEETGDKGLENAYEFLHNTFGEFLTADFILNCVIKEICKINFYKTTPSLNSELSKLQTNESWLNKEWYSCLMFTPLYTRTVVLEMMKEHKAKIIKDNKLDEAIFCDCLKFIVKNELKKVLYNKCYPGIMFEDNLFNRNISLLECLSVYTMNLIILASVLCPDGFKFDEKNYVDNYNPDENISSWRKLCSLWRSCFSEKDLTGLSSIIKANRIDESILLIISNNEFESMLYNDPIDISLCVSSALSENLNAGLAFLHSKNVLKVLDMISKEFLNSFEKYYPDFYIQLLIKILNHEINMLNIDCNKVTFIVYSLINYNMEYYLKEDLSLISWLLNLFELAIRKKVISTKIYESLANFIIELNKMFLDKTLSVSCMRILIIISSTLNKHYDRRYYNIEPRYFILKEFEWNTELLENKSLCNILEEGRINCFSNSVDYYDKLDIISDTIISDKYIVNNIKDNIDSRDISLWLETNPECVSYLIRILIQSSSNFDKNLIQKYLQNFLNTELLYQNLCNNKFKIIINSLIISQYYGECFNDFDYYKSIVKHIRECFFNDSDFLVNTLLEFPLFICHLIQFAPQTFKNFNLCRVIDLSTYNHRKFYLNNMKILDIIKALRMLSEMKYYSFVYSQGIHYIDFYLQRHNPFSENLNHFTVIQLEDLLWFSGITGNDKLIDKINNVLSSFNN